MAGYNASTLYNYFENLDHIIFLASMSYIKDYTMNLQSYLKDCSSYIEKYIKIWDRFCHYSFNMPEIYHTIFYSKVNNSLENKVLEYYELYPKDLSVESGYLQKMLCSQNMYDRGITLLEPCAKEGSISGENIDEINDIHILIYRGILSRVINKELTLSVEELQRRTIKYIIKALYLYVKKDYIHILKDNL